MTPPAATLPAGSSTRATATNSVASPYPVRGMTPPRADPTLPRLPLRSSGIAKMPNKVWFITGTSKGFGRVWAEAALARGDQVVATARDVKSLAPLVERYKDRVAVLPLDVNDRAAVFKTVAQAKERFGRIDVAVNNAGFGLFGAIEEISETEAREQIETNLFGALWV